MKLKKDRENLFIILLATTILLATLVGVYLTKKPSKQVSEDIQTQKLEVQEKSDEILSIEKDLKDTDFSDLDKELEDIESEISGI